LANLRPALAQQPVIKRFVFRDELRLPVEVGDLCLDRW
jgi:hypothetical protein